MKYSNNTSFAHKIIEPANLITQLQNFEKPIVFTNGCFDILHRGHVTYLSQAKKLGKTLIVALNNDQSVKMQNKGANRPINTLEDRMAVIASLGDVDAVTYFAEENPLELILAIRPNVLVKGGDWAIEQIVGSKEVLAYNGEVHSIPFIFNTSTTKIINKITHE
jgi:rfaE bifunctional protein nucleotidyltransferase chain/domain